MYSSESRYSKKKSKALLGVFVGGGDRGACQGVFGFDDDVSNQAFAEACDEGDRYIKIGSVGLAAVGEVEDAREDACFYQGDAEDGDCGKINCY